MIDDLIIVSREMIPSIEVQDFRKNVQYSHYVLGSNLVFLGGTEELGIEDTFIDFNLKSRNLAFHNPDDLSCKHQQKHQIHLIY